MVTRRREIVVDGAFDDTANWTEGTNWTVANGVAACAGNGAANGCTQVATTIAGARYRVEFDIVTVTAAGAGMSAVVAGVNGAIYTAVGHQVDFITATAGGAQNIGIVARGDGMFAGTIDNLSIERVS